jgi:hypothetical protein
VPAAVFLIVAFVGESLVQDSPDWLIVLVAVASGVIVGGVIGVFLRRRERSVGPRSMDPSS